MSLLHKLHTKYYRWKYKRLLAYVEQIHVERLPVVTDATDLKPITLWEKMGLDGWFSHNHIEDGHSRETHPNPNSPEQKRAWERQTWRKKHAHLTPDNVVVV